MRDFTKSVTDLLIIPTAVTTADLTPANGVDLLESESVKLSAIIGLDTGTLLDGSNNFNITIQDSADDSTYAAVVNPDFVNGGTPNVTTGVLQLVDDAAEASQIYSYRYVGPKRYARLIIEVTGTINVIIALTAERGELSRNPEV